MISMQNCCTPVDRFAVAMLTALLTRAVSAVVENVRATIIREKQSRMAQQYTLPSRAGCSVMSVHQNSLGLVAVNCRFTRSRES